ncbi:MAG: NAD(P)/FAD-dependent oxidoreductase [Proteobacteria bacterium]|nr:NAD(P)/FAD-dependent oxidoreductase [Pseudomonadota bacterium]MBU4597206.1 NAD(P)/FAD-dependent oxidoreductase [Pseudomonadota bacterium]
MSKTGLKVLVLEKAGMLGGCSRTDWNIVPGGYGVSTGALVIQQPVLRMASKLGLEEYGFEPILIPEDGIILRYQVGENYEISIPIYRDVEMTCAAIAKYSTTVAEEYRRMVQEWSPFTRMVGEVFKWKEPRHSMLFSMLESLGPKAMWLFLGRCSDIMRYYFSEDWIGGMSRIPRISGFTPQFPGSGYGTQNIPRVHFSVPFRAKGGMSGLIESLAKLIEANGGKVRKNAGVEKIILEDDKVKGVLLESGEEVQSNVVISGTNAKITYRHLVGDENLDEDFVGYLKRTRESMRMACVFVSMDQPFLPELECTEFQFAKGLRHTEINALDELEHRLPKDPSIYIDNPCMNDPTLAPEGKCWIGLYDSASYELEGTTWAAERERHADNMIRQVEKVYPDFRRHVIDMAIMDPTDYEREFNLWKGSIMGPALSIDQMFSMRLSYGTDFEGLYLTGMSTHPAGGMIGIPGWNSAAVVLEDLENGEIKV